MGWGERAALEGKFCAQPFRHGAPHSALGYDAFNSAIAVPSKSPS